MLERYTELLIYIAGAAILLHVALCLALQRVLRDHVETLQELFAIPNEPLSDGHGVRLLRARYYLPWHDTPPIVSRTTRSVRLMLVIARFSGVLAPAAFIAFFALEFMQSQVT
jgi:hypothetical protein